jgi:hypothetical protein
MSQNDLPFVVVFLVKILQIKLPVFFSSANLTLQVQIKSVNINS